MLTGVFRIFLLFPRSLEYSALNLRTSASQSGFPVVVLPYFALKLVQLPTWHQRLPVAGSKKNSLGSLGLHTVTKWTCGP